MDHSQERVALIGLGSIGISFAALHLKHSAAKVSVYDPRPDLEEHIRSVLPGYIDSQEEALQVSHLLSTGRLRICTSLEDVCRDATIVQEQGPENLDFKRSSWGKIIDLISPSTHMWSSTSGIAASLQAENLKDKSRLLVVHPFNPPHIMPILEIVPSPSTKPDEVDFALSYFKGLDSGHQPVVIHKEVPGFVANRLAFVLLREACHLVSTGVITAKDLDTVVEASVGPRWAVTGPFKSYNYGGGVKGLESFFANLSGTIQQIWDDSGKVNFVSDASKDSGSAEDWKDEVIKQTKDAYGLPTVEDFTKRDMALKKVLRTKTAEDPI